MRSLGWRVGFRVKRRNLESLSGEGKKKCGFWRKGNFFSGILLFFFSFFGFLLFSFFFHSPIWKEKRKRFFFSLYQCIGWRRPFGVQERANFSCAWKGKNFFFLLSRGRFSFFFEFSIGSAQGNSSSQCASRGNVARREIKKNDPSSFFFFCFEETWNMKKNWWTIFLLF